jgi:hypothetical protein
MRTARVAAVLVVVVGLAWGMVACGGPEMAKKPPKTSAQRLGDGGNRPIADMLSPEQEDAMQNAGMQPERSAVDPEGATADAGDAGADGDTTAAGEVDGTKGAQATTIAFLQVAITLGMMVAPMFM